MPAPSPSPIHPPLTVRRASVEVLRIYDVAEAVDLDRVEQLLAGRGTVARIRLARVEPKAIAFGDPPVVTELVAPALDVAGRRCEARAAARIHAFGVISLSLEVLIPGEMEWGEFETFAREAEREAAGLRFWRERLDALVQAVRPAMDQPSTATVEEDYAIITLREVEPPLDGIPLAEAVDLVPLLTHEQKPLSEPARAEVLRYRHSYYRDDAVVLTWDRAVILEPAGDDDVADVLEVANAQLLELRVYDERLDREIPRIYDVAEGVQRRGVAFFQRRYSRAANDMRRLVAEVSEITEKVDNALKVTEDVYLARVYTSALELFRVPSLAASIDRKLALIRDTYTALYDQAVATRAEWMEAAIVLLIVLEVVMAFFSGH